MFASTRPLGSWDSSVVQLPGNVARELQRQILLTEKLTILPLHCVQASLNATTTGAFNSWQVRLKSKRGYMTLNHPYCTNPRKAYPNNANDSAAEIQAFAVTYIEGVDYFNQKKI